MREMLVDLWEFSMERKKWWLIPMIVVFLIFGLLIAFAASSPVAPFIYTVF